MKTVAVGTQNPGTRWPEHLPVGTLRVVRWSAHYDQTVVFYRDAIGLPVLETFHDSYGLDGTILGLPGGSVHLEIVPWPDAPRLAPGLDRLVCRPRGSGTATVLTTLALDLPSQRKVRRSARPT